MDETITMELELAVHNLEAPFGDPHIGLVTTLADQTHGPTLRTNAIGGRLRFLIGGAPKVGLSWLYGGFELEGERFLSPSPVLVDETDVGANDVRMTSIIAIRLPIGIRTTAGPFQLSSELDPGFAGLFLGSRTGGDAAVDFEARGRIAVWCGPSTTVGVGVGIDLADVENRSAFVTLAGHFDPYDHPR